MPTEAPHPYHEDRSPVQLYTVEEAQALLDDIREHLAVLRDALEAHRFAREQADDLETRWTRELDEPGSTVRAEHEDLVHEAEDARQAAEDELSWFEMRGVEVKDPITGLVDFYHERDGEIVYLCWKEGEDRVETWHTLTGGFAGRRPLATEGD